MEKRLTNDENINNLKKRKILKIVIIIFSTLTIVLALASIFYNLNIIYPLLSYLVVAISTRKRNNIPLNKANKIYQVEKEIEKIKKHKK